MRPNKHCIVNLVGIAMEIFQQDFRLAYEEISELVATEDGHLASHLFNGVRPGVYSFKCGVTDAQNKIVSTQSIVFHVQ